MTHTDPNPEYIRVADHHATLQVLDDVAAERVKQRERYGRKQDLPDGTGPEERWLHGPNSFNLDMMSATGIEQTLRLSYELADDAGRLTWMHLVREEVAEAFAERDPARLRAELLQVAALAVSWVEALDARSEA